jgi:hypothetical protein
MTNWVQNKVTITGPTEKVQEIYELIDTPDADNPASILKHYFPLPDEATKEVEYTDKDGNVKSYGAFTDTGYDTALELWGAKWTDCDTSPTEVPTNFDNGFSQLTLTCRSAWSPPLKGWKALSEKFDLMIATSFEEEQPDFIGCQIFIDGENAFFFEVNGNTIFGACPSYPEDGTDDEIDDHWEKRNEVVADFREIVDNQCDAIAKRLAENYLKKGSA